MNTQTTAPWTKAKEYKTKRIIDTLSEDEEKKFTDIGNFKSYRDFLLCYFPLKTGLRPGEVIALNIGDVLFAGDVVRELELKPHHTKRSKPRWIPLSDELQRYLRDYITLLQTQNPHLVDVFPLFPSNRIGERLRIRRYQQIVEEYGKKLIGRKITPHIFRHTFATRTLRKSNLKVVQKLLGHSTIWTTSLYLHPTKDDLRQAIE